MNKVCKKCGELKPIEKFCYDKRRNSYSDTCNRCNYEKGKNRYTLTCKQCGEEFKSDKKKTMFCSRKCSAGNRKKPKIKVVCDYCKQEFERLKSQFNGKNHKFCSVECKNKGEALYYSGENSHSYNHDKPLEERLLERKYIEYYEWRKRVYDKDKYTCQCCGDYRGGNLVAHHILNYSEHEELRTDVNNGITLCNICHKDFHDTYGYKNNNSEQLNEFIHIRNNKAS